MRNKIRKRRNTEVRRNLRKIMKCLCAGEQLRRATDEMVPSSESLAIKDYSVSQYSTQAGQVKKKPDAGNIEEAESSLRESGILNYEVGCLQFP